MTIRQHVIDSNKLSKTATHENVRKMRHDVKKRYRCRPKPPSKFADAARVEVSRTKEEFLQDMDNLAQRLKTIPEEDVTGTIQLPQRRTEREQRRDKQAISNAKIYRNLLDDEDADLGKSGRKRLEVIYDAYYNFICTSNRPRWAQLSRMHREVTDNVARMEYAKEQLKSDVTLLRTFLREQLSDQYCLMRETPMEKKDETWLRYGQCLSLVKEIGEREDDNETNGNC